MIEEPIERKAVRILFIVRFCGNDTNQLGLFGPQYAIESELKLQKIQFWVRNPDYLADALLDACSTLKSVHHRTSEVKSIILKIFADQEPEFRTVPMERYFHGAYENLERVLVFLISRGLLSGKRQKHNVKKTYYFLTEAGERLVEMLLAKCDEAWWYEERCKLINSFWGNLSGNKLGRIQHSNLTYHDTDIAKIIRPITSEVRIKFAELFGEELPEYETR